MKFLKDLIVPFAFDFRNINDLTIDSLFVVIKNEHSEKEKDIFLENFYFFAKNENKKNNLIIRGSNRYLDLMRYVLDVINQYKDSKDRLKTFEDNIKDNSNLSYNYADHKKSRFLKGEHVIIKNLQRSYTYFVNYFKRDNNTWEEWKEAEDVISKDSYYSTQYAIKTNKLFPKGEEIISTDPQSAVEYAKHFKIRFKKCEESLLKSNFSYELAEYLKILNEIGEKWEEGEEKILSTAVGAFKYCRVVIKERDPRVEKAILSEYRPDLIYSYSNDIIKGRWEEGEERIVEYLEMNKNKDINYDFLYVYASNLNERVPSFEPYIIKTDKAMDYAIRIIKGRWPELEKIIDRFNPKQIFEYLNVTKHTFPKAEKIIMETKVDGTYVNEFYVRLYVQDIINDKNITPRVKNMIDNYFSQIKNKDSLINNIFHKFEDFVKLNYFKNIFNQNLPKIIGMIDPDNISYEVRIDHTTSSKFKTLYFRFDSLIYKLYDDRFLQLMNDDNKKLFQNVIDKTTSKAFKIIKEKELYEYPLSYRGESLTYIKNNDTIKKIIDLFNEQRNKEYAILNGKEEIKRINSIQDNREKEKAISDNASLIKRTLYNIIKYN